MWFIPFEGIRLVAPPNVSEEVAANYTSQYYSSYVSVKYNVLIDSGTSFVLLPNETRGPFIEFLNEQNPGLNCNHNQVAYCTCKGIDVFPDVYFLIGGLPYFIPKENYVAYDNRKDICYMLLISFPGLNVHIMGLNFFQNYYSVFDQEKMRVGFALSSVSNPRIPELEKRVMAQLEKEKREFEEEERQFEREGGNTTGNGTRGNNTSSQEDGEATTAEELASLLRAESAEIDPQIGVEQTDISLESILLAASLIGASIVALYKYKRRERKIIEAEG